MKNQILKFIPSHLGESTLSDVVNKTITINANQNYTTLYVCGFGRKVSGNFGGIPLWSGYGGSSPSYFYNSGNGGTVSELIYYATPNRLAQRDFETNIYPNPSTDKFTIETNIEDGNILSYTLLDMSGKVMMQQVIAQETYNLELDLSALAPAIYFLQVQFPTHTASYKLIKQ